MTKSKKMLRQVSWEKFRQDGMLWLVNRILHIFGYAISFEYEGADKGGRAAIKEVYPVKCKFRGFCEKVEDTGFKRGAKYMQQNIQRLIKDLDE